MRNVKIWFEIHFHRGFCFWSIGSFYVSRIWLRPCDSSSGGSKRGAALRSHVTTCFIKALGYYWALMLGLGNLYFSSVFLKSSGWDKTRSLALLSLSLQKLSSNLTKNPQISSRCDGLPGHDLRAVVTFSGSGTWDQCLQLLCGASCLTGLSFLVCGVAILPASEGRCEN